MISKVGDRVTAYTIKMDKTNQLFEDCDGGIQDNSKVAVSLPPAVLGGLVLSAVEKTPEQQAKDDSS